MLRNIPGSLLALIGAVPAVRSSFRVRYGGCHGSDIRVGDLFTGVGATPATAALLGSLFFSAWQAAGLRRPAAGGRAYVRRDDAPVPFVASSAYTQRSLEHA